MRRIQGNGDDGKSPGGQKLRLRLQDVRSLSLLQEKDGAGQTLIGPAIPQRIRVRAGTGTGEAGGAIQGGIQMAFLRGGRGPAGGKGGKERSGPKGGQRPCGEGTNRGSHDADGIGLIRGGGEIRLRTGDGEKTPFQPANAAIVGGEGILKILQTLSIAAAFPYMFVIVFMMVSMAIALKNDPAGQSGPEDEAPQPASLDAPAPATEPR